MTAAVVVMARFNYQTSGKKAMQVKKGDLGLLQWRPHRRHPRYLEPVVVWDKDGQRKCRKIIWSSLSIVGLQTAGTRIMLIELSP
jgi:hypothetical protein